MGFNSAFKGLTAGPILVSVHKQCPFRCLDCSWLY